MPPLHPREATGPSWGLLKQQEGMHSTKYSVLGCHAARRNSQKDKEDILALEGLFSKPAAILVANTDLLSHGGRMSLATGQSCAAACLHQVLICIENLCLDSAHHPLKQLLSVGKGTPGWQPLFRDSSFPRGHWLHGETRGVLGEEQRCSSSTSGGGKGGYWFLPVSDCARCPAVTSSRRRRAARLCQAVTARLEAPAGEDRRVLVGLPLSIPWH